MKERFTLNGKLYKTVECKSSEEHCEKCAFGKYRECEYVAVIPECDSYMRDDGKDVYFIEARSSFDRITVSPEALAEQLVYHHYDEFNGDEWFGVTGDGIRESFKTRKESVTVTLEWLKKEKEE